MSDQPSTVALIDDGHVAEWKVPTHDRFPEQFRMKNHAYAAYLTDNAIIYNVNKLTAEEIKLLESDWRGVLDPRFKGRFAATTMKCGACYAGIHMFLDPRNTRINSAPNSCRQDCRAKAGDLLRSARWPRSCDRWRARLHLLDLEGIALTKMQQGAPVRWIHPKPTPIFSNSWQFISKNAPHPNAARLFQNWITSEEGMKIHQILRLPHHHDRRPRYARGHQGAVVQPDHGALYAGCGSLGSRLQQRHGSVDQNAAEREMSHDLFIEERKIVNSQLRGKVAVVGVGTTRFGRFPGWSAEDLGIWALDNALADCGLKRAELDGLIVSRIPDYQVFCEMTRIAPRFVNVTPGQGRMSGASIELAVLAVTSGMCETIALVYGNNGKSAGATYGGAADRYGGAGGGMWTPTE